MPLHTDNVVHNSTLPSLDEPSFVLECSVFNKVIYVQVAPIYHQADIDMTVMIKFTSFFTEAKCCKCLFLTPYTPLILKVTNRS